MSEDVFTDPLRLIGMLDQSELRGIVARCAQVEQVTEVSYHLHRSLVGCQGYSGKKVIISALYRSASGHGWIDLLLKCPPAGCREHTLYPLLMAQSAPVPRLEGLLHLDHAHADRSQDLLVLEYLPHIGFGAKDRMALATTLGRFHAMRIEGFPGLTKSSFRADLPQWMDTWRTIAAMAPTGELGDEIKAWCAKTSPPWDRLEDYLAVAVANAESLVQGVVHRDVSPQNTGWRADKRELLLFDVPQMAQGCLVHDLVELFPADQPIDEAVSARYRETLSRHGGPAMSPSELQHGLRVVRPLKRIGFLAWSLWICICGRVDWTDDVEEGRRVYRAGMLENLKMIVASMSEGRTAPAQAMERH